MSIKSVNVESDTTLNNALVLVPAPPPKIQRQSLQVLKDNLSKEPTDVLVTLPEWTHDKSIKTLFYSKPLLNAPKPKSILKSNPEKFKPIETWLQDYNRQNDVFTQPTVEVSFYIYCLFSLKNDIKCISRKKKKLKQSLSILIAASLLVKRSILSRMKRSLQIHLQ